jgi:hypothetical protein
MSILSTLRNIVTASDAADHGSLMNTISAASEWLAEHDASQTIYANAIRAARDEHQGNGHSNGRREGVVELDDEVMVSAGRDPGLYVSAWVWIDFEDEEE